MTRDYSLIIPISDDNPAVYLYSSCTTDCSNPATVYIFFSSIVKGFSMSKVTILGGIILSLTQISNIPPNLSEYSNENGDIYVMYIAPITISSSVSLEIPSMSVVDSSGHYNRESNSLSLSFLNSSQTITTISSRFTNMNPYEVFLQFPDPIVRLFDVKIETTNCNIAGLTITNPSTLRIVLSIEKEGTALFVIPSGLAMSDKGYLNDRFEWSFVFGIFLILLFY